MKSKNKNKRSFVKISCNKRDFETTSYQLTQKGLSGRMAWGRTFVAFITLWLLFGNLLGQASASYANNAYNFALDQEMLKINNPVVARGSTNVRIEQLALYN